MKKVKVEKEERVYFFDTMRAILILFIVFIHVLQNFNSNNSWLIHNPDTIQIAPFLIDSLMLFTLQSFFIMSGYLAIISIKKTNINNFFNSRIKRILIPIFFTALTFNSLQTYVLYQAEWIKDFTLYAYLTKGEWISHLWFLIDLVIFFLLTYLFIIFFSRGLKKITYLFNRFFENTGVYFVLVLFSFIILLLLILFSLLSPYIYNHTIDIRSIFFYFPFFVLGAFLATNKDFFKAFIQLSIIKTLLITILLTYISIYFSEGQHGIEKMAYYFFNATSNLFASALCFSFFYKFFNKKSKLFHFLAEASFSVYLFHHLVVVSIGIMLIKFHIGGYLALFILFGMVIVISLIIHHFLISKIQILGFLYNGKSIKREKNV